MSLIQLKKKKIGRTCLLKFPACHFFQYQRSLSGCHCLKKLVNFSVLKLVHALLQDEFSCEVVRQYALNYVNALLVCGRLFGHQVFLYYINSKLINIHEIETTKMGQVSREKLRSPCLNFFCAFVPNESNQQQAKAIVMFIIINWHIY